MRQPVSESLAPPVPIVAIAALLTLRDRPAAYGLMEKCLLENAAHRVSRLGRIFGVRPVHRDARPWFTGALGEVEVARLLRKLGPEWTVLHSVPIGSNGADVDHVLVGPPGVFALNTKNHAGKKVSVYEHVVYVGGHKEPYLQKSRDEQERVSAALRRALGFEVPVESMLVFVGPDTVTGAHRSGDVTITTERLLLRLLRHRKPVLSPETVAEIADVAANVRTWHPSASTAVDVAILNRFAELRRATATARLRRLVWASAITFGIVALVVWLYPLVTRAVIAAV
jgi:Nuclease-related domain